MRFAAFFMDIVMVYIRPQRCTKEFVHENGVPYFVEIENVLVKTEHE